MTDSQRNAQRQRVGYSDRPPGNAGALTRPRHAENAIETRERYLGKEQIDACASPWHLSSGQADALHVIQYRSVRNVYLHIFMHRTHLDFLRVQLGDGSPHRSHHESLAGVSPPFDHLRRRLLPNHVAPKSPALPSLYPHLYATSPLLSHALLTLIPMSISPPASSAFSLSSLSLFLPLPHLLSSALPLSPHPSSISLPLPRSPSILSPPSLFVTTSESDIGVCLPP